MTKVGLTGGRMYVCKDSKTRYLCPASQDNLGRGGWTFGKKEQATHFKCLKTVQKILGNSGFWVIVCELCGDEEVPVCRMTSSSHVRYQQGIHAEVI